MKYATLLFDLDGTLVDSLADLTEAVNHMRNSFSLPPLPCSTVRAMVGKGARNLVRQALPDSSPDELGRGLALFINYNERHIADHSRPYPGIADLLETIAGQGVRMAVVSNKNEALSRLILERLGLARFFDAVCGGDTCPEMKPSPLPLFTAIEALGGTPDSSVMIGDSINDIGAGRNAGITTVGCSWGYGSDGELRGADCRAGTIEQLLKIHNGAD